MEPNTPPPSSIPTSRPNIMRTASKGGPIPTTMPIQISTRVTSQNPRVKPSRRAKRPQITVGQREQALEEVGRQHRQQPGLRPGPVAAEAHVQAQGEDRQERGQAEAPDEAPVAEAERHRQIE